MAKPTIITRASKGSALTWTEGDANLTNLRDATIGITDGTTSGTLDLNDTLTFTAGTNVTLSYNSTTKALTINAAGGSGITDIVQDTTPQLGGNLDVNGKSIVSTANGNITIDPNGTGSVVLGTDTVTIGTSSINDAIIETNSTTGIQVKSGTSYLEVFKDGGILLYPATGSNVQIINDVWPISGKVSGYILTAGAGGVMSWSNAFNGTVGATTPTTGTFTTLTSTGRTVIKDLTETVYTLSYSATITPNVANGTVQVVTLTGNVTFSAFTSPVAGQSLTLIVKQDATGNRTLTSTMKFSGGSKTLSTAANSVDIITVFYDGTNYWASLGKDFK